MLRTNSNPLALCQCLQIYRKFLTRKWFAYLAAKRSRYCGSAEMYQEISTNLEIRTSLLTRAPHSPSTFVSHSSSRYTRLALLATWDITSRKTVINCFSLVLRTCLPLAVIQHLISVFSSACTVYLLARQYTAFAVCTLKYHFKSTLLGGRLSFFIVRLRRDRPTQNALRFEYGYCRSGQYDI